MTSFFQRLFTFAITGILLSTPASARSIILIIGDGFDDQHVTMARNYLQGAAGKLRLDDMPFRGAVQIETLGTDGKPVYVADSANTATSLATGVVTQMGRVGTAADDSDAITIAERAVAAGYRTGIVSTASVTDATPASFMAHVARRFCENPQGMNGRPEYGVPGCPQDARENGGPGSIAEQIARSSMTVILGGGARHFQAPSPVDGVTALATAQAQGFAILSSAEELTAAKTGSRVLGLFASSHLPVRWQGTDGRIAEPMIAQEDGDSVSYAEPEPMSCEPNPEFASTPDMAVMTQRAIELLNHDNPQGFFLMVESASIDKQSHARNPCGSIGEVEQLEEALAVALEFAAADGDTLVLVTADHAQAAQILSEPSMFATLGGSAGMTMFPPGHFARIRTPEGSTMRVNYGTNNGMMEEHTGANVPLFGNAVAADFFNVFSRQRDVHDAMASFLELP